MHCEARYLPAAHREPGLWGLWSCSMLPVEAAPSSDAVHPRYLCSLHWWPEDSRVPDTPLELENCVVDVF
jgi:hypothetical protein